MNENQETLKLIYTKYNANISKRKPQQIKNYLSDTISSQNKKQFKYVRPSTPTQNTKYQPQIHRTKTTTIHLELPQMPQSLSTQYYQWNDNNIVYDNYNHFTTNPESGYDPYGHFE
jgi:hypothetical protein